MVSGSGLRFEASFPQCVESIVLRKLMMAGIDQANQGDLFFMSADELPNINYYNAQNTNPVPNATPPYQNTVKNIPIFVKDSGVFYHEFYNDYFFLKGNWSGGKVTISNFVIRTANGNIPQFTFGHVEMQVVFKDDPYLPSPYTDTKFLLSRQQGGY